MSKIHGSHWGAFEAEAEDGRIVSVRPLANDPDPSPILSGMAEGVHHECRVRAPAVREGWLKNRDKARGGDRFVEVPWDEALDMVAEELRRVKETHGNESIFAGSYGWSSAGRFHHAKTQLQRFMNCFGGYTAQKHSYSLAAGLAILPHIVGNLDPLRNLTSWASIAEATDTLVAFGGIPIRNTQVEPGGTASHTTVPWLKKLAERGTHVVSVTPLRNDTPEFLNAQWLAPRPNTDVALMMGLAHTLVDDGLHDSKFLETYAVGGDTFLAYLTGEADGTPKSADWASEICDIPADTIRELARRMAAGRTMIACSYSLQRGDHGEQTFWMTMALACILGQIGLPGGGFGFGYGSMHGQGNPVPKMPSYTHSAGPNPTGSFIPVARVTDMLLNPGMEYDFDGERRTYPDIKLVYWCGGNPFHHHQDLNRLLDGWRRPDTVIVNEPWWTPTAKLADIVLPATMFLEHEDMYQGGGHVYLQVHKALIEAPGECRSNVEVINGIARRLGSDYPAFHMTAWELIDDALKRGGRPGADEVHAEGWLDCTKSFEDAHFLDGFGHADGRFHFAADWSAIGADYDAMSSLPDHLDVIDGPTDAHPYRLVAAPARRFLNTSFTETPSSRKKEGRPTALIHPDTCATLGLAEDDQVRLGNELGSVVVHVRPFDGLQAYTVVVEGIWPNDAFVEGRGINTIVSADAALPGGGAAFHDTAVWMRPA